jgi:hypothetical protein
VQLGSQVEPDSSLDWSLRSIVEIGDALLAAANSNGTANAMALFPSNPIKR